MHCVQECLTREESLAVQGAEVCASPRIVRPAGPELKSRKVGLL